MNSQKKRSGWFSPEESATGIIITILDESEVIHGLPKVFHFQGLVPVVTSRYPSNTSKHRSNVATSYRVIFVDYLSPQIQAALRALLGDRLYDQVVVNGEVRYQQRDDDSIYLPEPEESDFKHMLRAIRADFESNRPRGTAG